jgi:glycogen(starch) synthase
MPSPAPSEHLLEVSWEVCNKVGGIHTVITTKLTHILEQWGDRYAAVGPWLGGSSYFKEATSLGEDQQNLISRLAAEGITLHIGSWLVPENPSCYLVDWAGLIPRANAIKSELWEQYALNTLGTDFYDVDVPMLWSYAVGRVAHYLAELSGEAVVLQAHEWLSSAAILSSKSNPKVRSVFTTHATVLGRAISSTNANLYENLDGYNPDAEAERLHVVAKHQLERLGAQQSSVFTTVSSITAREATTFLGRTPDILTENGIDPLSFPHFEALQSLRNTGRQLLTNFVQAYFSPSERIDLANTFHVVTMGRYELRNKGYDLLLQSLGKLNTQLKKSHSNKTVIAWILVPGDAGAVRRETLFAQAVQQQLSETLARYSTAQQHELYQSLWEEGEHCANMTILPPHVIAELKQLIARLPQYDQVPLSPWHLNHEDSDAMLTTARDAGLTNSREDRVKVVFAPAYLDGFDGLFNRSLYELVAGCDLGLFPSKYEPWGYTPMESMVLGVPTITTDFAGFGVAVETLLKTTKQRGFTLITREGVADDAIVTQLTEALTTLTTQSPHEHVLERMGAYELVQQFGWSRLYQNYKDAYAKALQG